MPILVVVAFVLVALWLLLPLLMRWWLRRSLRRSLAGLRQAMPSLEALGREAVERAVESGLDPDSPDMIEKTEALAERQRDLDTLLDRWDDFEKRVLTTRFSITGYLDESRQLMANTTYAMLAVRMAQNDIWAPEPNPEDEEDDGENKRDEAPGELESAG